MEISPTLIIGIYFFCILPQYILWGLIVPINLLKKKKKPKKFKKPVSVIVAARNEEKKLPKLLNSLISQDFSTFEIIVINDRSTDSTGAIIQQFADKYDMVKKVEITNNTIKGNPKKNALTQGIKIAKFEHFLFIDADCWVISNSWIKEMSAYFNQNKILIGIGLYYSEEENWVSKITNFETYYTALQYTSFSNIGINFMAVGRNFGYTKNIFEQAKGFQSHQNIMSGDDDLMVNQMSNATNTISIISKNSITYSHPEKDWKSWFRQKIRHISAGYHYKFSNKLLLGTLSTSHISVYFIYLLMIPLGMANLLHLSIMFLIRIILIIVCFKKLSTIVGEKIHWWYIPILDLMLIAYQILIGVSSVISKRKTWI